MKPLIIAPHYHTYIKDQVDSLSRYMDSINVLVHHNYLSEIAQYLPFSYFRRVEKVSKRNLVDLQETPDNIKVYILSMLYFIPDSRNLGLGNKLYKKFRWFLQKNEINFDLIHAHFIWPSGYSAALLKNHLGVPLVITGHGFDVYDVPFRGKAYRERLLRALRGADKIITVSYSNFFILTRKLGITPEKISVIPNGFDSRKFRPMDKYKCRERLGLPMEKKIILTAGNLFPVKGHEYLLKAAKIVLKREPNAFFVIVGSGPLQKRLKRLSAELGISRSVSFVGSKPHNELPLWMNAADIFVLPSLNEGNPTVMFEALGVGLPFVGTKVGGVPEIIISEDYGLLCEPGDIRALANAITKALDISWDRSKILKYSASFSWERISGKIYQIYRTLL